MEQGLVYVEYISRLPGVPLAEFQRVLIQAQQSWASGHGEDRLLLSAGRTWRLGPEPEYLHVWHSPGSACSAWTIGTPSSAPGRPSATPRRWGASRASTTPAATAPSSPPSRPAGAPTAPSCSGPPGAGRLSGPCTRSGPEATRPCA